jgi:hypothetical protein
MLKKSDPDGHAIAPEQALADERIQLGHLRAQLDAARSDSPARLRRIIEGGLGFGSESAN